MPAFVARLIPLLCVITVVTGLFILDNPDPAHRRRAQRLIFAGIVGLAITVVIASAWR